MDAVDLVPSLFPHGGCVRGRRDSTMNLRAEVDHELCSGYAECTRIAPSAFRINAGNQSEPIKGAADVPDELLLAAARECPTSSIRVVSASGEVIYESG